MRAHESCRPRREEPDGRRHRSIRPPEISLEQYTGQRICHDTKLNLACGPYPGRKDPLRITPAASAQQVRPGPRRH